MPGLSSHRFDSFDTTPSSSRLLVSKKRSRGVSSGEGSFVSNLSKPPPVWPAVLLCLLHNISMGAAMMAWIDVCRTAFHSEELKGSLSKSLPQTLYGRLLATNAICELLTSNLVGVGSDSLGRRAVEGFAQLGQLIDYSAAAFCLPAFGIVPWSVVATHRVAPLLFVTRGIAGLLGNFRVALQSYTVDISSPKDCPTNLSFVGAALVVGMCMGSGMVAAISSMEITLRACYFLSLLANFINLLLLKFAWRDVAPKRRFNVLDANPFAGMKILFVTPAMTIYASLCFLASFAASTFTSTLAFYCEEFLDMDKTYFSALGAEWAFLTAFSLAVLQPYLASAMGEIRTLQFTFFLQSAFYLAFSFVTAQTWMLAYVIIILFGVGSMAYPMSVALASREVDPEVQGKLQGSLSVLENIAKILAPIIASDVLIPMFDQPGQFNGMVYLVAGFLLLPGVALAGRLKTMTTYVDAGVGAVDTNAGVGAVGSIEMPENS